MSTTPTQEIENLPRSIGTVKFLQVNLNHCKEANTALLAHMEEHSIDVAFLQDAYCSGRGSVPDLGNCTLLSSTKNTAHLAFRKTNLVFSHLFADEHCVFASLTTREGEIIFGSVYLAPGVTPDLETFNYHLDIWQHLITYNRPLICAGDFNANSQLWGSPREDQRGESLLEFLVANNLSIYNIDNRTPTFVKRDREGRVLAKGFPDLTIVNNLALGKISKWQVLDTYNSSDHRYIQYNFTAIPLLVAPRRYSTKKGNFKKFTELLKTERQNLKQDLRKITNADDLNHFTESLIATLKEISNKSFRLRSIAKAKPYSFWSSDLRSKRNELTALRRKIKRLKLADQTQDCIKLHEIKYKKQAAAYKRSVLNAKCAAWRDFCSRQADPFGPAHKIFSGKFFKPDEVLLQRPSGQSSRQHNLEYLTRNLFGPSKHPPNASRNLEFQDPDDPPFSTYELRNALKKFKDSKAPGPDGLDFRILKHAFKVIPKILTRWSNHCLALRVFPECLRQGEVVYFLKQGKSPQECDSYRPICLLPTLGKLLEKLLVQRLTHHLETNGLLHKHQFGFREGHSCEKALSAILKACADKIAEEKYTTLVSLDIKGAFDRVEWVDILNQLIALHCPGNVAGVISSYLSERFILVNWGAGVSRHRQSKGCPQGSCLGPILWLIIANIILNHLGKLGYILFAFADDFSFVFSGRRRRDLEREAAAALPIFCAILAQLNLNLSVAKTKALTFRKPKKLERNPVIRVNNISAKHVNALPLLGLTIDKHQNWFPHIASLKLKLLKFYHNSKHLTTKSWGINNELLKLWYLSTTEKVITYAAGIWGGNLSEGAKTKLFSIQRPFLLQLSRGYRSISSEALCVITGIAPVALTLEYEYRRSNILH